MYQRRSKVLCKFKAYSITKSNELFYPGAVVVINRLGVKNNKAAEERTNVEEEVTK